MDMFGRILINNQICLAITQVFYRPISYAILRFQIRNNNTFLTDTISTVMIEKKDYVQHLQTELPHTYSSSDEQTGPICIRVKNLDQNTHENIDSSSIPNNCFFSSIDPNQIWGDYWDKRQELKQKMFRLVAQGQANQLQQLLKKETINLNEYHFLDGWTLLHHATNLSNVQIIKILVDNGCAVNEQTLTMKSTPLHLAVLQKNISACTVLLKLGADPNISDVDFFTPMHYIVDYEYSEILDLFLKYPNINFMAENNRKMNTLDCCRCEYMRQKIKQYSKIKVNEITHRFYLTRIISIDKERKLILRNREDYVQKMLQYQQQINRDHKIQDDLSQNSENSNHLNKLMLGKKKAKNRLRKASWMAQQSVNNFKYSIASSEDKAIQSLQNYDVLKILGTGSFGQVFLARKKKSSHLVAIKRLKKKQILQKKMKKYVMAERAILKDIQHPFIVHGHSFFQDHNFLYMVMEFCPGGDMEGIIRKGKLQEQLAKKYCCQIVLALEQLHKSKYLFRDLKSANVLIDENGHLKLSDFGLAKQSLLSGSFLGSFAYLAPQMLVATDNKPHSFTIDWYLLGVFVYELLVGFPPFYSNNKTTMLDQIKNSKPKIPSHLSAQCREFLLATLQKNPQKRLGNNGADEIKNHQWFKDVDWLEVEHKKIELPKPEINWSQLRKRQFLDDILESNNMTEEFDIRGWNYCQN